MSEKRSAFVMDCSAMIAFILREESLSLRKIEVLIKNSEIIVPTIWSYEISNVFCMTERSKRISEADLFEIMTILKSFSIRVDEMSGSKAFSSTLNLAREHQLTVYDAAYLELSMREAIPLATLDKQLNAVAKRVGIRQILS